MAVLWALLSLLLRVSPHRVAGAYCVVQPSPPDEKLVFFPAQKGCTV